MKKVGTEFWGEGSLGKLKLVAIGYHSLYCHVGAWKENTYCGRQVRQLPLDLWLMQEVIWRERPDYLIESGVAEGGSTLYYAHIFDAVGKGMVIGVDIKLPTVEHPRIKLIKGDSVASATLEKVAELAVGKGMVTLDSDHHKEHVLKEMELYSPFVGVGQFMVVQDTHLNGRPIPSEFGPGPGEAVDEFLSGRGDFVKDGVWQKNWFSFHEGGWLRRVK